MIPIRIQVKDIAMAKAQELLVLLGGHSGLTRKPNQLAGPRLRGQHSIALISGDI